MSLLASILVAAEEAPAPLLLPAWAFALIAAAIFVLLGFVTWSYRDVANRHSDKTSGAGGHDDHGHH